MEEGSGSRWRKGWRGVEEKEEKSFWAGNEGWGRGRGRNGAMVGDRGRNDENEWVGERQRGRVKMMDVIRVAIEKNMWMKGNQLIKEYTWVEFMNYDLHFCICVVCNVSEMKRKPWRRNCVLSFTGHRLKKILMLMKVRRDEFLVHIHLWFTCK